MKMIETKNEHNLDDDWHVMNCRQCLWQRHPVYSWRCFAIILPVVECPNPPKGLGICRIKEGGANA